MGYTDGVTTKKKSEKPETRRDQQARESKDRIYEAGIALFSHKGVDETSIAEICRAARCSVGAFYHHFPTKDAIIEENFRRADQSVGDWGKFIDWDGLTANKAGTEASLPNRCCGREAVLSYMDSYARLVVSSGLEFSKRFYTWKTKTFIKKGRPMQTRLIELLQKGIDSGELCLDLPAEEACDWLFMCARGVVLHWCLHEGSFDLSGKMRSAIDRALRGITVEHPLQDKPTADKQD